MQSALTIWVSNQCRKAALPKRAGRATRVVRWRRHQWTMSAGYSYCTCGSAHLRSKCMIADIDIFSDVGRDEVDLTLSHWNTQHLLKTDCLTDELQVRGMMRTLS
jgi:hypothetical protein